VVLEQLTRKMRGAHHYNAGGVIRFAKPNVTDPIECRIYFADVRQIDRFGRMLPLIIAQREHALTPVTITVAEHVPCFIGRNGNRKIGKIVWRIAADVGGLANQQHDQHKFGDAPSAPPFPDSRRP
jgi:hypothetical protein